MLDRLPTPEGRFSVGRTHLSFVDPERTIPYQEFEGEPREIPLLIWYPSDASPGDDGLKYVSEAVLEHFRHGDETNRTASADLCSVLSNAHAGLPLSASRDAYPVLLFNHGYTTFQELYSIYMEHLASHGYILVSIGHPGDAALSYPDGRTTGISSSSFRRMVEAGKLVMQNEHMKHLSENRGLAFAELKAVTERGLGVLPEEMSRKIALCVEDNRFVLDRLEEMQAGEHDSIFTGRLALDSGVGCFGHSLGGITATRLSCVEARIACIVNLDAHLTGAFSPEWRDSLYDTPTLIFEASHRVGWRRYFCLANLSDAYLAHIKGTGHDDYCDFTSLYRFDVYEQLGKLGTADGGAVIRIVNHMTKAFFDKYLLKKADIDLMAFEFPELELERNGSDK